MKILSVRILFFALSAALLFSCSSDDKKDGSNLPPATGLSGDIYLVMDKQQHERPLGRLLDSAFNVSMQGLPREEAIYNMIWIDPAKLNMVLKQRRNIIMVMTLDQNTPASTVIRKMYTAESIEKIKNSPESFFKTARHVYSKGQEVMYLFGRTEDELLKNVKKNINALVEHFDRTERERITTALFRAGQVKGVSGILRKNFQTDMKIPFGFKLVMHNEEFLWTRQINSRDDRDVFVARKKYSSPTEFSKENLIAFRDEICKKYLFGDPDQPDTYLITETNVPFIPVESDTVNMNKHFAVELRGLWKTNTASMGGPFVGYALVDEGTQYLYYVEGFVYGPGKPLRELIREMESILYTFKTSDDLAKEAKK